MSYSRVLVLLLLTPALLIGAPTPPTLRLGFNLSLTGPLAKVGESSKFAAELLKNKINDEGGVLIGKKRYKLEFLYQDNEDKAESAVAIQQKLIEQDKVLAVVGPNSSKEAVPAGQVSNDLQTPMISPWSTNPDTTKNRPYVFRAAFLDTFQGPVAVSFAMEKFKAKKAAILYSVSNDFSKGIADIFKKEWEKRNGAGSVVAFESSSEKDQDFSAQLTKIISKKPEFIFLPNNYNEVALIVRQAQELGWKGPILGPDSWASADLMKLCGDACKGYYYSTHYAAAGATGDTKKFIDVYKTKYKEVPDEIAALTWDAVRLVLDGVQRMGVLSDDLKADRKSLREKMASAKDFKGVTGKMSFNGNGDPVKCIVVVKIDPKGEFVFEKSVCP